MPLVASAAALPVGTRIADRYEVLALLGRGGMGVVYRARDHELESDVAVKTLSRSVGTRSPVRSSSRPAPIWDRHRPG